METLTTALLAPVPHNGGNSGGGNAPLWIVIPIMVIALSAMIVHSLRGRD